MARVLQPEVLRPARDLALRTALFGLPAVMAAGGIMLAMVVAAQPPQPTYVEVSATAPRTPEPRAAAPVVAPLPLVVRTAAPEPAPAAPPTSGARDFAFVFEAAGSSYMALAPLDEVEAGSGEIPPEGELRLHDEEFEVAVVAGVREEDVPGELRAWKGRRVRVDGACEANVTGFALVSRLVGDSAYAAGSDGGPWTAEASYEWGERVLAARLDGCTGLYARDASLPPVLEAREVEQPFAVAAAQSDLLRSKQSARAQADWRDAGYDGDWAESARIDARLVRHPETGARYVSVHAIEDVGCGGVGINLWGLYRLEGDRPVRVSIRSLEDVGHIERFLDLNGDGRLELLASDRLGIDRVLLTSAGEELERLRQPFYGCPC